LYKKKKIGKHVKDMSLVEFHKYCYVINGNNISIRQDPQKWIVNAYPIQNPVDETNSKYATYCYYSLMMHKPYENDVFNLVGAEFNEENEQMFIEEWKRFKEEN
jgi:hypothetical protein